jgi:hypothetical protein
MFTPRVSSGRGGHFNGPARMMGDHRQAFAGSRHGTRFGGFRYGRDHDNFWGLGLGWWGPAAVLSFGYNDYPYDGWYDWPRPMRYAGWYGRPAYSEPAIRTAYRPAYRGVTYVTSGQSGLVRDDIRDARSPDQLRSIYGAQAEQLIRQGY